MIKSAVNITPIITPGSPPPPSMKGRPGIPSPNPSRTQNVRGGPSADFVARSPSIKIDDGLRSSTMNTENLRELTKVSKYEALKRIGIPTAAGAGLGYLSGGDLESAIGGGATGAAIGGMYHGISSLGEAAAASQRNRLRQQAEKHLGEMSEATGLKVDEIKRRVLGGEPLQNILDDALAQVEKKKILPPPGRIPGPGPLPPIEQRIQNVDDTFQRIEDRLTLDRLNRLRPNPKDFQKGDMSKKGSVASALFSTQAIPMMIVYAH